MQRAGHVVLDGVVDPESWVSYKVTASKAVFHTFSYPFQAIRPSLTDAEKTYSVFADACVQSGRARCKLLEFLSDGAKGPDIVKLLDDAHDVRSLLPCRGRISSISTPPDRGKAATRRVHPNPYLTR